MFYDVDEINYIPTTEEGITGKQTEAAGVLIKCRVEESNGALYNKDGEKIKTTGIILIDKKYLATPNYNDQIQITKKTGSVYFDAARKFKILQIIDGAPIAGGFWEITY